MNYALSGDQITAFLLSLLLGAVLCTLYDFIRVLHKLFLKGFAEVFVTDVLFWLFSAIVSFCFLIIFCKGYVRGYIIFGEAVGFCACRLTLSKPVYSVFFKIAYAFSQLITRVSKFISNAFDRFEKIFQKCQKALKKYLKLCLRLLYNCKPKKKKEL